MTYFDLLTDATGRSEAERTFVVTVGIVTDNHDPKGLGRVKVKFPGLSDDEIGHWARMAVPMAAAQGYDASYLLTHALFGIRDGKLDGPAVKHALENIPRIYYGVVATYEHPFSRDDKDAITQNMLVMGKVQGGAVTFAYPEDAKRNLIVQRKK